MIMSRTHIVSLLIVISSLFLPFFSDACSVCGGGYSEEQVNAYLLITGLLAGMAIIMMCLLFWGLHRYNKKACTV